MATSSPRARKRLATVVAMFAVSSAVPAIASAAPTASTALITSYSKTVTTGQTVFVSGKVRPADYDNARRYQLQIRGTGPWKSLGTRTSYGSIYSSFKAGTPKTYQLRLVVLANSRSAAKASRPVTMKVLPNYPIVTANGGSMVAQLNADTTEAITFGAPISDASIPGECFGSSFCLDPNVPTNGSYVTVPVTITMLRGQHDYNPFNFELKTPDGQVYSNAYVDTKHGQQLNSGTLFEGDTVSGVLAFDTQSSGGYRIVVDDYFTTLAVLAL